MVAHIGASEQCCQHMMEEANCHSLSCLPSSFEQVVMAQKADNHSVLIMHTAILRHDRWYFLFYLSRSPFWSFASWDGGRVWNLWYIHGVLYNLLSLARAFHGSMLVLLRDSFHLSLVLMIWILLSCAMGWWEDMKSMVSWVILGGAGGGGLWDVYSNSRAKTLEETTIPARSSRKAVRMLLYRWTGGKEN